MPFELGISDELRTMFKAVVGKTPEELGLKDAIGVRQYLERKEQLRNGPGLVNGEMVANPRPDRSEPAPTMGGVRG